jgi:hypothetical protein
MLVGEKCAGAAHSGLHLVEHQQRAVLGRDLPRRNQITGGRNNDSALPHDRLQEHGGSGVVDDGFECRNIAIRDMGDVAG